MLMVPFLFYAGVVFAYFLVLPAAVDFLQNFNDDNYDVLLQARDYNKFAVMVMGVMGLLFQLPVVILAITRMGIVTPQQLRKQRRDRHPRHRRPRRAAARRRPRDDAADDVPDPRPLRGLYPSRLVARAPRRRAPANGRRPRRAPSSRPSTPTTDALRPQRFRPPQDGQDRVRDARHPDGRRPGPVRHRRQRRALGRPAGRHHRVQRRRGRRHRPLRDAGAAGHAKARQDPTAADLGGRRPRPLQPRQTGETSTRPPATTRTPAPSCCAPPAGPGRRA